MSIEGIRRTLRIRFTRHHLEREVDDEIAYHVERRAEQLRATGLPPDEAFAEARRRFGDVGALRNACLHEDTADIRRQSVMNILDTISSDLRFAARSLKRAPAFTAVALATLIVGIASVTALFSLLYSYAYRPLPYKEADRIVAIGERHPGPMLSRRGGVSRDAARAILAANRSFEQATVFENGRTRASVAGRPAADMITLGIDSSFLPLLGVQPARGRAMSPDEIENRAPVALISDALWQSAFGGEENVVGRTIPIGDERVTIVGVMAPEFRFPSRTDMWRPRHALDSLIEPITVLGKMKAGIARRHVDAELASIGYRLAQIDSQQFADVRLTAIDMIERGLRDTLPVTAIFILAALFVLLITCSNVANLLLVRSAERRGEMAVRASLGASRGRLLMQALTESLVLSVLAGIGGVFASAAIVKIFLANLPVLNFPTWLTFGVDGGILLFVTGVVVVVTLGVGLSPAFEGMRFDLVRALKIGGDAGTGNRGVAKSARRGIIFQLSLSVTLFVGAALLYQSYRRLSVIDVGYPAEEIASLTVSPDVTRYPTDTSIMRLALEVLEQTRRLAGVRAAAVRSHITGSMIAGDTLVRSKGQRVARPDARLFVDGDTTRDREARGAILPYPRYFAVSDDYFRTLDLRILVGRSFSSGDVRSALVAVLSKRFADALWPDQNAVGHVIQLGATGRRVAIVGIVEDVRDLQGGPAGLLSVPRADAYFSARQLPGSSPLVLARGSGDMTTLMSTMQAVARRVDPQTPVEAHMLLHEFENETVAIRLFGLLIGGFAISGLVLSMIGIYGVIAYGVAQRTREIGIRIALGGTSDRVLRLIVRDGLAFTVLGLVIGVVLSLGVGRLLKTFLFGVSATDPLTYLAVCLAFGAVALVSCYLPARRVLRVDPMSALRAD